MIHDLKPNTQYEFTVKLVKVWDAYELSRSERPMYATEWIFLGQTKLTMEYGRFKSNPGSRT